MRGRVLPLARRQQTPNNFSLQAPILGFAGDLNLDRALGDITGVGTRLQPPAISYMQTSAAHYKASYSPSPRSVQLQHHTLSSLVSRLSKEGHEPIRNFPSVPWFRADFREVVLHVAVV